MKRAGAKPLLQVSATCCQPLVIRLLALTCLAEPPLVATTASITFVLLPQLARVLVAKLSVALVPLSLAVNIPWFALVVTALIQSEMENAFSPSRKLVPLVWRR